MSRPNVSVSRNFRFDKTAATWLEFESKRKGVSVNALVNNIFRKYGEFDRLAERTEMVTLSKGLVQLLIEAAPEAALNERAFEYGKQVGRDHVLFWKKKVNTETVREYISETLCQYCNLCDYDVDVETDTLVLTHDLGPKGTAFLKAFIDGLVLGCLGKKVHIDSHVFTISFSLKNLIEN
jgi:hypothetical protein